MATIIKLTMDVLLPAAVTVAIVVCLLQLGFLATGQGDTLPAHTPAAVSAAFAG